MIWCPSILELPPPPEGKVGWPWAAETSLLAEQTLFQKVSGERPSSFWPSISIVTPSYNQGQFIEETIRSILLQGYPNIEFIIVDGGSNDESVPIIKKYSRWLKVWVSEPDSGQSHAINKGLLYCEGEIFNWINSDDLLTPGALYEVALAWKKEPHTIIAGRVIDFDEDGNETLIKPKALSLRNFVNFQAARKDQMTWHQPGTFLPRVKVMQVGGVQENLKFNMDHFLMIELLRICKVVSSPVVLARFRLHQHSKTVSIGHLLFKLERFRKLSELSFSSDLITEKELKQEGVAILFACASVKREFGFLHRYSYYGQALLVSPIATAVYVVRRSVLRGPLKFVLIHAKKLVRAAKDSLAR